VAWVLTELVGYPVAARSCAAASSGLATPGSTHPRAWVVGLAITLAVAAASGVWVALLNVRSTSPMPADASAPAGRAHFMAVAGVFVSSIFLAGTILYGVPSLIVNVCARVR
jgi:hypothetical protein